MVYTMNNHSMDKIRCLGHVQDGMEIKSGNLIMVQCCHGKQVRVPVIVRVYHSTFEHYAVFYRDCKFTNAAVYVSLKHCTVFTSDKNTREIKLVPENIEGSTLTFEVNRPTDVCDWIKAFQSQNSTSPMRGPLTPKLTRSAMMPVLQESLEESEEEECSTG